MKKSINKTEGAVPNYIGSLLNSERDTENQQPHTMIDLRERNFKIASTAEQLGYLTTEGTSITLNFSPFREHACSKRELADAIQLLLTGQYNAQNIQIKEHNNDGILTFRLSLNNDEYLDLHIDSSIDRRYERKIKTKQDYASIAVDNLMQYTQLATSQSFCKDTNSTLRNILTGAVDAIINATQIDNDIKVVNAPKVTINKNPTVQFTEILKQALKKDSLLEALSHVINFECERAVRQAIEIYSSGSSAHWRTNFNPVIKAVLNGKTWDILDNPTVALIKYNGEWLEIKKLELLRRNENFDYPLLLQELPKCVHCLVVGKKLVAEVARPETNNTKMTVREIKLCDISVKLNTPSNRIPLIKKMEKFPLTKENFIILSQ